MILIRAMTILIYKDYLCIVNLSLWVVTGFVFRNTSKLQSLYLISHKENGERTFAILRMNSLDRRTSTVAIQLQIISNRATCLSPWCDVNPKNWLGLQQPHWSSVKLNAYGVRWQFMAVTGGHRAMSILVAWAISNSPVSDLDMLFTSLPLWRPCQRKSMILNKAGNPLSQSCRSVAQ
jgi:hypothetical protein